MHSLPLSVDVCLKEHSIIAGLPTVRYESVSLDSLDDRLRTIRQDYGYEGEVLYFLDADNTVMGLLKKKTIWYILCRAIREKLRATCSVSCHPACRCGYRLLR